VRVCFPVLCGTFLPELKFTSVWIYCYWDISSESFVAESCVDVVCNFYDVAWPAFFFSRCGCVSSVNAGIYCIRIFRRRFYALHSMHYHLTSCHISSTLFYEVSGSFSWREMFTDLTFCIIRMKQLIHNATAGTCIGVASLLQRLLPTVNFAVPRFRLLVNKYKTPKYSAKY